MSDRCRPRPRRVVAHMRYREGKEVINVTMQSTAVMRQLARERQATLRATPLLVGRDHSQRRVRRWIGRRLVSLGTRLAAEPMRPVRAR
jgi:hypothetical protein